MNRDGREQKVAVVPNSLGPRIVSGSLGSIFTALVVTPLEVVKIRQQSSAATNESSHAHVESKNQLEAKIFLRGRGTVMLRNGLQLPKSFFPCLVAPGHTDVTTLKVSSPNICPRFYESTLCTGSSTFVAQEVATEGNTYRILRSILHTEGVSGLYTGLRPTLLMTVPNTALTLTLYDEIKNKIQSDSTETPVYATLCTGAFSRCIASTFTLPLELIRTRQASFMSSGLGGSAPGLLEDFQYLLRSNGIGGLYKGLQVTLLRDSSFSGIYFLCLEWFRARLKEMDHFGSAEYYLEQGMQVPPSVTIIHNLLSGAGAAIVATLLTGPLDTAKTRKQMISKQDNTNIYKEMNMPKILQYIYKREGLAGLWKGNVARCTKVVPASAIMIACYELGKDVIKDVFH
ncbi:hypothetical protein ACHAXN_008626 [Cyclotella atomus]